MKSFDAANVEILKFIADSIDGRGFPPTQQEVANHMGYAGLRAAQYRLEQIEENGWIDKTPGIARGIRISESGASALSAVAHAATEVSNG